MIDPDRSILEIGPFTNPFMRGANVRYFDVLDTRALLARAIEVGYAINNPPHIDYVSADGDLSIVRDKFHAVVSSHVIEHQPDLVSHLLNVERLLHAGGAYFLVVPDQRYCFDYPLELSQEDDVVRAYVERRRRHTLDNVVRCRARTTHNDAARHWNGDHFDPDYSDGMDHRQRAAVAEHQNAGDRYVDVHAWQFTPSSFFRIIDFLYEKRLIRLVPSKVFNTPRNKDEFCAILTLRR
ncbi:MAG: methyltransferase domain-containing protein [Hyphomicrobiales bacterium]|nr:methyltransferase domain-containing protein [Hyphomicrobiales bacterium]